jgi:hypothetical protein
MSADNVRSLWHCGFPSHWTSVMSPGGGQVMVYAVDAFCKKSFFFTRATLLLLGLVRAVSRRLKMQAISKTPLQGLRCRATWPSSKKKKFDRAYRSHAQPARCQGSSISNACSFPLPFDHQNLTLRFVAGRLQGHGLRLWWSAMNGIFSI